MKEMNKESDIYKLGNDRGKELTDPKEIENEILQFYSQLVGETAPVLRGIDIDVLRRIVRSSSDQLVMRKFMVHCARWETIKLHNLMVLMRVFYKKKSWKIVGEDLKKAVLEFFPGKKVYAPLNCTLVTLIPKVQNAKNVKDLRQCIKSFQKF